MLTIDMLKQNTALSGLSDDLLSAIAEMSRNDENSVIGTRIGELHGRYDADVMEVTGLKKKDGEKSYDYVKRVLGDYKGKIEAAKADKDALSEAQKKIADLEAKIAAGSADAELTKQLKDTRERVSQLQESVKAKDAEIASEKAKHESAMRDLHVDYAFRAATEGIKFKEGVDDDARRVLLDSAKSEILAKGTPELVDDGKGGKTLVFRDASGKLLNNPKNNLNPYTLRELVMESRIRGMIDTDGKKTGAGTGSGNGSGSGGHGSALDLSAASTQVAADKLIEDYLLAKGLTRDSADYHTQFTQLRTEGNVASLPIR